MKEKVSVVITSYNSDKFIERSLNSVLNQTFKCYELIIVDDCSIDSTVLIIKKYQKKYSNIRLFINKVNKGGPAHGRNVGIKKSAGNYIAFLDADDFWYPKKIEKQILILKNKNYSICGCRPINKNLKFKKGTITLNNLIIRNRLYLSSTFYDLDEIKKNKLTFNESNSYHGVEDYDFIIRCSLLDMKIYNLDDKLISYSENEYSLSHIDYNLNERRRLNVLKNLKSFKIKNKILSLIVIFFYSVKIKLNEI